MATDLSHEERVRLGRTRHSWNLLELVARDDGRARPRAAGDFQRAVARCLVDLHRRLRKLEGAS